MEETRIPASAEGIQVNFCKSPVCSNYGVPASAEKQPKGPGAAERVRDAYTLCGGKRISRNSFLRCNHCKEEFPVKSNIAIDDELNRLSLYLDKKPIHCPNNSCDNHKVNINDDKNAYQSYGKTKTGSQRYRCKLCKATFTVSIPSARQRLPHKNIQIFKLLINKMPFKRIREAAGITMSTIYDKIDFLHRQCQSFAASREVNLADAVKSKKLYIAVDRQDYMVNWNRRKDKRNIVLHAIGSADNTTGYVFGLHLNYDPFLDCFAVETDAIDCGDYEKNYAYRKYARIWLYGDYQERNGFGRLNKNGRDLVRNIETAYKEAAERDNVEASDVVDDTIRLPERGMQIHSEYTMYGHFLFLRKMLTGANKIRFFLDQESGIRAACLSAFVEEIKQGTCDAFYVKINKDMTVDERKKALADVKKRWAEHKALNPELTDSALKLMLIKERMAQVREFGKWNDRWVYHPFPSMSEPEKAVCYLTNTGKYDEDHLAWLYNKASLHAIDRVFMQIRRRLSLLERPIASASSTGRKWHGYSAYNPAVIVKLLDIFRCFYNYVEAGNDGRTPAMRLGLAKGRVEIEDIIYYTPYQ